MGHILTTAGLVRLAQAIPNCALVQGVGDANLNVSITWLIVLS
ncbi:hypothetical protein GCM10011394_05970 [Luteimonas terricola]|uniref:Uncharacterized protein n=1 Tax=Luteimonas terricola TaxID=645597 RepID=A0ABQ2E8H7_9GAMM|nr:hypothetical protein GCM10011394_05970 [Luteimonas terricola]